MDIDEYNRLTIAIDFNKLLVPTPPIYASDSSGNPIPGEITKGKDPNVSPVTGIIQSFYDAPYGTKEELEEWTISPALEYWYNKLFSIRAGYFWESKYKGNRQFFTVGAGLRYNVFGLDFSYLIPVRANNPLMNTMQFTLLFNFDKVGDKEKQSSKE
jgi:glycosyltransferase involved in cell wall biosynthesis